MNIIYNINICTQLITFSKHYNNNIFIIMPTIFAIQVIIYFHELLHCKLTKLQKKLKHIYVQYNTYYSSH